ncbi:transcription regulator [Thermococcus onnurineus NA1]|uniref:Transcription regulator n=1 Tax=Thermococcus onnurineus (strain NA1) TaxID=523850 RepID=B6YU70_THEON|nr:MULTISPECIES: metalloregulator ArsR/SmtB family transcription factor [Thermococcus]ACJ16012.1 transcription regulator [Thermococcus onnurineus NA1]NJE46512.1 ArsR family transcriptional regulator [Thermococcus sp. GR7]NJE77568.1 ArsR family transcriptional regulator [Thermococcus sp. GR4]NJF23657.1 ArsR family transcriptional regulator [Thermococcus sp. GR5]
MRVREVLNELDEKQRRTVLQCSETCGIPDLDKEVNLRVEEDVMKFLKALSNPLRLRILKILKDNWLCVCLISKILDQDQTLISHHLRTLKALGLILERKEGKMHFYRTNTEVLEEYLVRVRTGLV